MEFEIVFKDPHYLIVIKNDNWYSANLPNIAPRSIYDIQVKREARPLRQNVADFFANYNVVSDPLGAVLIHYAMQYGEFIICDVGAHYGETAMEFCSIAQEAGGTPRVFAFDAGIAANLTWRNFEINGFDDIKFEHVAVGAVNGHGLMYREPEESTGNRVILGGAESYPVKFVSLDVYLANERAIGPAVVKIDVQGAEPLVLEGMTSMLAAHPIAMLMEFTPWALRQSEQDPHILLEKLSKTHILFDVGFNREHVRLIEDNEKFVSEVDGSAPYWRDVIAIPSNLVEFDVLFSKFMAAHWSSHDRG